MGRRIHAATVALLLAGCAGHSAFQEGRSLVEAGNVEEGLARIQEAAAADPSNEQYRLYYLRQREIAVQHYLALAEKALASHLPADAEAAYRRVLRLDPSNAEAREGLKTVDQMRRHQGRLAEARRLLREGSDDAALEIARAVLAENPQDREARAIVRRIDEQRMRAADPTPKLNARLSRPITLEFRDAPLRAVFELVSKQSGLNFVFDRDVPADARTTVFVKDIPIEEAIRLVLMTNQLERKVLNENTVLIYPDTAAKRRDYRELVMRSFYLTNADAKQTASMIRTLLKTRDVFVDDKLNLVVMRDTPEAVRLAERLVANQDLSAPEVMLEVEVLEVSTTLLKELGIQWPSQASLSIIGSEGVPGTVTLPELRSGDGSLARVSVSDPLLVLNLRKQDGQTNTLANPRIRVRNREKAKILIGDRVPVITTTTTATGFAAETVSYLDVGLKLDVEPTVHLDNEVGVKIGLEVSRIAGEVRSASGTTAFQIGTRNAATTLRLKHGETQVLAGLISDEDRRTAQKVPGLGDLPVLGRLFSSVSDTVNKTEIVLLITPRIVRNLERPDVRNEEFATGTESAVGGAAPGMPSPSAPLPAPTPAPSAPQQQAPAKPAPQPQTQQQQQQQPPAKPQPESQQPSQPTAPPLAPDVSVPALPSPEAAQPYTPSTEQPSLPPPDAAPPPESGAGTTMEQR